MIPIDCHLLMLMLMLMFLSRDSFLQPLAKRKAV